MFTGLIEELGALWTRRGSRFTFEAELVTVDTKVGDSIAVNGCCLTVVELGPGPRSGGRSGPGPRSGGRSGPGPRSGGRSGPGTWSADVVDETLARTNLGALQPGDPVNLERPLRLSDRLGGHVVQGHVDGLGEVVSPAPDLAVRTANTRYLVEKGSVAVDGVSLTVVEVNDDTFRVAVIPHTASMTTLGRRQPGDRVNLEFDILAKYVERLLPR